MIYIFDTSAFIKGMDVSVLQEYECYTTSEVLSEIKHKFTRQKIDTALLTGNLKIQYPDPSAIKIVKKIAQKSGDLQFLSATDIGIIALALTLQGIHTEDEETTPIRVRIEVVTDDYSIQNVLSQLQISSRSYMQKGIDEFIQWQIYCPICNAIYESSENSRCPKCEVNLKRRPINTK
jgi:UPF0271 protein